MDFVGSTFLAGYINLVVCGRIGHMAWNHADLDGYSELGKQKQHAGQTKGE